MEIKETIQVLFKETDKMNDDIYSCMDDQSIINFLKELRIYDLYLEGAKKHKYTAMLPLIIHQEPDVVDIFFISKHSIKEEDGEWSCMICLDFINKHTNLYPAISVLEQANGADIPDMILEIIKQVKSIIREKDIDYRLGSVFSPDTVVFFWDKTRPELN